MFKHTNPHMVKNMNNGSDQAMAWMVSMDSDVTNNRAAANENQKDLPVQKKATRLSVRVFAANKKMCNQRTLATGSIPNKPGNARTTGKKGGKWVIGAYAPPGKITTYPRPAARLRAVSM